MVITAFPCSGASKRMSLGETGVADSRQRRSVCQWYQRIDGHQLYRRPLRVGPGSRPRRWRVRRSPCAHGRAARRRLRPVLVGSLGEAQAGTLYFVGSPALRPRHHVGTTGTLEWQVTKREKKIAGQKVRNIITNNWRNQSSFLKTEKFLFEECFEEGSAV